MFVELHMIQNFAPSCLNRDDTNAPKDCEFGGVRRARISSQCLKRSVRKAKEFEEAINTDTGVRTKFIQGRLKEKLVEKGKDEKEIEKILPEYMKMAWGKVKEDGKTAVLLYIGDNETEIMVQKLIDNWDDLTSKGKPDMEKLLKKVTGDTVKELNKIKKTPDISLFGRMVADNTNLNIDAACQMAHAISTHKVSMEMDFYTAVDDLQEQADPGAGMMGEVEFNSACFYRYSAIDMEQLKKNLAEDEELAKKTVDAFLRASVATIPTGKQNSMAAYNPPGLVMAIVREKGPRWSLANAFEEPVQIQRGKNGSFTTQAIEKMGDYWENMKKMYGDDGIKIAAHVSLNDTKTSLGEKKNSLEELYKAVQEAL